MTFKAISQALEGGVGYNLSRLILLGGLILFVTAIVLTNKTISH